MKAGALGEPPGRAFASRSALLILLGALVLVGSLRAQEPPKTAPCTCADLARLKDRLLKLEGIEKLIARKLQSTGPTAQATQADWEKVQAEISSYLRALQLQNMTAFPDSSLFPGADPSCTAPASPASACTEQEFAAHQSLHAASCSAGRWTWQSPWPASAMLQEEAAALQAEIDALEQIIDGLHCTPCPQFMVTVQVVTTTAVNGPVTERSQRSLNNGQGIQVPLTMQADGTFSGTGIGADTGMAAGAGARETVSGGFGHLQAIYATGTVQGGTCTAPPCTGDIMHLTLIGGSSTQITEMQARGPINRDLNQATPTGGATMRFDLPAYVGAQTQRTLLANGIINSVMQVTLGQASNGSPLLPTGGSVLLSTKECKNSPPTR